MLDLHDLWADARKLDAQSFLAKHSTPVLVLDPFQKEELDSSFETLHASETSLSRPYVVKVAKRPGANPFGLMVTIGRARNNDIRIPAPEISKFHAYVMLRNQTIVDAGSTFGTWVESVQLEARVPAAIYCGVRIKMGPITMHYFLPAGFLEYLRETVLA